VSPQRRLLSNRNDDPPDQGGRFLLLFALANAGGVIAYTPLLTLLLPAKVALLAGEDRIVWLGAATLFGAIAASVGNIAFGWASDVIGTRKRWAAAGLLFTLASYAAIDRASDKTSVVAAILLFQLAVNMLLAPLFAWAADTVPDSRKGLLGGLIAAGQPLGALAGVVATMPLLASESLRLGTVCLLTGILVLPLLLAAPPRAVLSDPLPPLPKARMRVDFALAWSARLLMQTSGNVLFAFLLYYFFSLPQAPSQPDVARLSAASLTLAFPLALLAGRLSDRLGPRRPFLAAAAAFAALGLGVMATSQHTFAAMAGYVLFSSAAAVFASLHTGYSMQLLPSAKWRGRDMGLLNLTNTLPAVVAPLLTIALVPHHGFAVLLEVLSLLAILASISILLIRNDRQAPASVAAI